jgi:phosphate transport system ATP-binding protein
MEAYAEEKIKIEAQNINFYYGQTKALNNVNLNIHKNEVTAFIGPSGCGKTTFLRLINRMNDLVEGVKLEGKMLIDGRNIYSKETDIYELRKSVGMVFQRPNPFPKTIFENVAFGLRVNNIKDKVYIAEVVENSLRQAALWDEVKDTLDKSANALSGGQQQRLCIARTLAIEPSIILMDEPTSALDPISTAKVEQLIYSLKDKYTIVIVTHNMQQAGRISDKTAFFYMGELIEMGKTKKIFTNPKMEQTQNYITGRFG